MSRSYEFEFQTPEEFTLLSELVFAVRAEDEYNALFEQWSNNGGTGDLPKGDEHAVLTTKQKMVAAGLEIPYVNELAEKAFRYVEKLEEQDD